MNNTYQRKHDVMVSSVVHWMFRIVQITDWEMFFLEVTEDLHL